MHVPATTGSAKQPGFSSLLQVTSSDGVSADGDLNPFDACLIWDLRPLRPLDGRPTLELQTPLTHLRLA